MSYVLFRHRSASSQYCAVAAGEPAPSFISAPDWAFAGTATANQLQPNGFHEDAARQACRAQGFYTYRSDR
jgi:hypothetical protein